MNYDAILTLIQWLYWLLGLVSKMINPNPCYTLDTVINFSLVTPQILWSILANYIGPTCTKAYHLYISISNSCQVKMIAYNYKHWLGEVKLYAIFLWFNAPPLINALLTQNDCKWPKSISNEHLSQLINLFRPIRPIAPSPHQNA